MGGRWTLLEMVTDILQELLVFVGTSDVTSWGGEGSATNTSNRGMLSSKGRGQELGPLPSQQETK